ncbi:MAG: helix-turn-helix domain-containing protein [Bacteroidota bacterium]
MKEKKLKKVLKNLPTISPCPIAFTVKIIGGKWKPGILWELTKHKSLRFGQLAKLLPEVAPKMLTQNLRELEKHSIVNRKVYAEVPPRVEYSLTKLGKSLYPILYEISIWGIENNTEIDESEILFSKKTEF